MAAACKPEVKVLKMHYSPLRQMYGELSTSFSLRTFCRILQAEPKDIRDFLTASRWKDISTLVSYFCVSSLSSESETSRKSSTDEVVCMLGNNLT